MLEVLTVERKKNTNGVQKQFVLHSIRITELDNYRYREVLRELAEVYATSRVHRI